MKMTIPITAVIQNLNMNQAKTVMVSNIDTNIYIKFTSHEVINDIIEITGNVLPTSKGYHTTSIFSVTNDITVNETDEKLALVAGDYVSCTLVKNKKDDGYKGALIFNIKEEEKNDLVIPVLHLTNDNNNDLVLEGLDYLTCMYNQGRPNSEDYIKVCSSNCPAFVFEVIGKHIHVETCTGSTFSFNLSGNVINVKCNRNINRHDRKDHQNDNHANQKEL
jgi:hypothetical protein